MGQESKRDYRVAAESRRDYMMGWESKRDYRMIRESKRDFRMVRESKRDYLREITGWDGRAGLIFPWLGSGMIQCDQS